MRGQAPYRAVLAGVLAVVALSGCAGGGGTSKAAAPSKTVSASPSASPSPPPTMFEQFQALATARGITVTTKAGEADSLAANLCDNTAADMDTLLGLLNQLPGGKVDAVKEDTALMDTYCPNRRDVLTQASLRDAEPKVTAADFKIGIKILKQSCFGSAGCNVTYRIDPQYVGPGSLTTGSYEVTYSVAGDEDGPKINTFTIENGTGSYDQEENASTKSSKTVLTATVTEVSKK